MSVDSKAADFRFRMDDDLSDLGGAASRFKQNLAAITLLKQLEAESRGPRALTSEEQQTLSRYTGWGDSEVLHRAFPSGTYSYSRPIRELEELLMAESLRRGLNAAIGR